MRVLTSSPQVASGGRRMTLLGMGGSSKQQQPPAPGGSSPPVAQVLPGCLYFTSVPTGAPQPKSDARTLYVPIADQEPVHYDAFYDDFGPLNLAVLYRFCQFLNDLIQQSARHSSSRKPPPRIFLYTDMDPQNRVNAVYLIASYMHRNGYALFAVVNHNGSTDSGHYSCYIRHQHDNWYNCNDQKITRERAENVLASEGYLLFYCKSYIDYD